MPSFPRRGQGLLQRTLCNLLMVADPRGERNERGSEPVLRCTQHQLLRRRSDRLLPHEGKVIGLQYAFRRASNDGIVSIFLLKFLMQLHKARLRQLCTCREAMRLHKVMEVCRQLVQIFAQIVDVPADRHDIRICRINIVAQFPQAARDVREIGLRNHTITHTFPFFLFTHDTS